MLLFDNFRAVKFEEENQILISNDDELKYIYYVKQKIWKKYKPTCDYIKDQGWCFLDKSIKPKGYFDIDGKQILEAMQGNYPTSEVDILRLCIPSSLDYKDYLHIIIVDYRRFFYDLKYDYYNSDLYKYTEMFLANVVCKEYAYKLINLLFKEANDNNYSDKQIINRIKKLSISVVGRNIYNEIGITDGHDCYAGFWIMPAKTIYKEKTDEIENIYAIESNQISISYNNSNLYSGINYLLPFLIKYYDNNLKANVFFENQEVKYKPEYLAFSYNKGNYYSLESIEKIINDIRTTIEALSSNSITEYTSMLKQIDSTIDSSLLIDFYQRLIYRMEYMLILSKEKGYDLIHWAMV